MRAYKLAHLSDAALQRDLAALVVQERGTTAKLLAHIAEFDARQLYRQAGYPSMYVYCVEELRLSEEAAYKRIHAARAGRRFPAIFPALGNGRLHLSAVVMLAPFLTEETAAELLESAANQSKSAIEQLLARRFPRPDIPTRVQPLMPPPSANGSAEELLAPVDQHAPGRVEPRVPPPVTQRAPERFALQVTIGRATHDKLRRAQELLGHQIPSGDVAQVLDRALDALIERLEKRKFAATKGRPSRPRSRSSANPRHIPAHVRRTVWERDRGRCTFVAESGQRCPARKLLEFDHVIPVACGGQATVEGIRLRCRAHNQFEAERSFGAEFMNNRREQSRLALSKARAKSRMEAAARGSLATLDI